MEIVTCAAPVNIAVVKYWGKRDEKLNLPINDSISVTLSVKVFCAKTTVTASPEFKTNRIWLNGREESFETPRLLSCLSEIRERARKCNNEKSRAKCEWNVHVCSENNFPTAAGLASSAAGYACLAFALAKLFGVTGDISDIARRGSGSACRSILGGFVHWHMGTKTDGSDSVTSQIAPSTHWKELKLLILIAGSDAKKVGSTVAMKTTVETSDLLKHRAEVCAPKRIKLCIDAIQRKDFQAFAEITMKESNQLHAVCLDTYPPVFYLSQASRDIIQLVHAYNNLCKEVKVCYTFDAGENAFLFLLEENVPLILSLVNYYFPPGNLKDGDEYFKGERVESVDLPLGVVHALGSIAKHPPGTLKGILYTDIGDGPVLLKNSEHLLDENGLPKMRNPNNA